MSRETPTNDGQPILEVKGLTKHFPVVRGAIFRREVGSVKAVDGISFSIQPNETLGLVGESGCGKTTTGNTVLQLEKPTSGEVIFEGRNLVELPIAEQRRARRRMQMIFQDPFGSLNPRMPVGKIIEEPLGVHGIGDSRQERRDRVAELLRLVGLSPNHAVRYPHEFSGGQRQRIALARALAVQPSFIVCDEPVSALDVSIQAQIINLFLDLQEQLAVAYLFISHDLKVVRQISDRIAVMYLGKIVELAPSTELYSRPLHPYSRALLSAVPLPDPDLEANRERIILTGDVPSPVDPPSGCRFHPRCPWAVERCGVEDPPEREVSTGHFVACHLAEEIEVGGGALPGANGA
ncbi:MAG TPA: ABC transporter ATP-binding protein [Chloroflexota bacterium]|nr:ABC transporter ATP-binding protein [Chloroflexota bacterium]